MPRRRRRPIMTNLHAATRDAGQKVGNATGKDSDGTCGSWRRKSRTRLAFRDRTLPEWRSATRTRLAWPVACRAAYGLLVLAAIRRPGWANAEQNPCVGANRWWRPRSY